MNHEKDWDFEQTLADSELLLKKTARSIDDENEYSLESILAEFGGKDAADEPAEAPPVKAPLPSLEDAAADDAAETAAQAEPDAGEETEETPQAEAPEDDVDLSPEILADAPQPVSLQSVLEDTVQTVLREGEQEVLLPPRKRRLFSRRPPEETEALYDSAAREEEPEEEPEPPEPPEAPLEETTADYRELRLPARRAFRASLVVTALMWLPTLLTRFSLMPALYAQERLLNCLPFFIALLLVCALGRDVFVYAFEQLLEKKITYELLSSLLCLAALADTALFFFLPEGREPALPFHAIAALSMTCALFGRSLLFDALYDSFRIAAIGEAPYMVTVTAGGAAKRNGGSRGFSNAAQRDDLASRWQSLLLPVILSAVFVFSVLATLRGGNIRLYAWNLSALLAAANALAFPLVYALALRSIAGRIAKSGSALAGYAGADALRRSNCVILTDTDLFPPGTVMLGGLKIFGEESRKVITYAATMARASQSGLSRLFDELLLSEGGFTEPLSDLNFYEEGGVAGTIHGETVLFGTAAFCRKMHVTLPSGLSLKTGVFLAVDGALIAVFAVKYMAAENVDWALHALRRAKLTPVLAVRDGNITPALLKRKFGTDAHAVYPKLSTRLALSEKGGGKPSALLFREGLMPYAEVVIGAKRLVRAVRLGAALSLFSSVAGTLLTFYLAFVGAYTLLTPSAMLTFLVLWGFAALLDGLLVSRY